MVSFIWFKIVNKKLLLWTIISIWGSRGLMVESRTHNERLGVRVSFRQGFVGGGEGKASTEPPTAPRVPQHKWLPTAPGVCSRCVCVCVCVFTAMCVCTWMGKCRAWIPSMGHFHFQFKITDLFCNTFKNVLFQHHHSILQHHMILQKSFYCLLTWCSSNISYYYQL